MRRAGWIVFVLTLLSCLAGAKPALTYGISPAQFWRTAFGSGPWYPMAGDVDGDGQADLVAIGTDGNTVIDICRTSPLGKPVIENIALGNQGPGLIASSAGPFVRKNAADIVYVFSSGVIKLAWGMAPGGNLFLNSDPAGQIPEAIVPQAPTHDAAADFDGDGKADVMILDKNGKLVLLRNDGTGHFQPFALKTAIPRVRQYAAGTLAGGMAASVVWIDESGNVSAAKVVKQPDGSYDLAKPKILASGSPDEHLAVGRFRGGKAADILVGQRLFVGGDPKTPVLQKELPTLKEAKDDGVWNVADIDGNGKDDLIRHHEGHERWGAQDVFVHFSYDSTEPTKGFLSTANDGLPDFWKLGKVKPGGLDLATMGCKPGHRDVIVEVERFDNVDFNDLKNHMNRAIQYFASIPLKNPDGTSGIALHVLYYEPWPLKDHDKIMGSFDQIFPRKDHRGIVHTMFAEVNGPLVAQINGDKGHFNGHWSEFVHEFGHELDLTHDGFYGSGSGWGSDTGSAIYPSLMSYTYSYGLDNSGDKIGYSDGARASFAMNPRHLSEKLPFNFETVRFLGAEPYHYRVSPTPDGKGTLIDWNWNGVLGEDDVVANVKYTHGTDFGAQYTLAKTDVAPVLVAHGGGQRPRPLIIYAQGASLAARAWIGLNRDTEGGRWSDEENDHAAALTGDPTAVYFSDGTTWVAYPTAKGVALRPVTVDGSGHPRLGKSTVLNGTVGVQPTLAALGDRLVLLSWRSKALPLGLTILRPKGDGLIMGGEKPLDLRSDVPVGATAGKLGDDFSSLWVGRIELDGLPNGGQTEVIRMLVGPSGGTQVAYRSWVTGTYARHRMTLLWRDEPGKLPEGRLYLLTGGISGGPTGTEQYITMNIPYPDYSGGWIYHRYRQPNFTSPSAPAACFFDGDIVYGIRHYDGDPNRNNNLDVSFYGTGATPWPMGDFDDIGHIRDYGLSHSIRALTK